MRGCLSVRSNPLSPIGVPNRAFVGACEGGLPIHDWAGERLGEASRAGSFLLNRRPLVRALLASAAIAAALTLAGCDTDGTTSAVNGRHMQPLSDRMQAEIESKNMAKESPILVRIFKEESELEVWKQDRSGRFALLNTYPICR